MSYIHCSCEVYKTLFCFLYGIGRQHNIMVLKNRYLVNDLETLTHGNRKQLPHNQMTHRSISDVIKLLQNCTEENAILLHGQLTVYRRDDINAVIQL